MHPIRVLAFALVLVGCGGSASPTAGKTEPGEKTASPTRPAATIESTALAVDGSLRIDRSRP